MSTETPRPTARRILEIPLGSSDKRQRTTRPPLSIGDVLHVALPIFQYLVKYGITDAGGEASFVSSLNCSPLTEEKIALVIGAFLAGLRPMNDSRVRPCALEDFEASAVELLKQKHSSYTSVLQADLNGLYESPTLTRLFLTTPCSILKQKPLTREGIWKRLCYFTTHDPFAPKLVPDLQAFTCRLIDDPAHCAYQNIDSIEQLTAQGYVDKIHHRLTFHNQIRAFLKKSCTAELLPELARLALAAQKSELAMVFKQKFQSHPEQFQWVIDLAKNPNIPSVTKQHCQVLLKALIPDENLVLHQA